MSHFAETRKRLQTLSTRVPDFPLQLVTLTRLNYHIQKRIQDISNAVLRQYGLSEVSYIVLAVLYGSEQESLSPGQLTEACSQKPANMTRVCNELEKQGLISRSASADDRRAVVVTLRPAGRELISQVMPAVWHKLRELLAGFSPEEIRQQEDFYQRQLHNLNTLAGAVNDEQPE
ncbi:MarR family transcriptional regulator [Neisseriaceae bacterium TC5R-5]|nr:MarR family transcriptional regulator [Neisseriaceae bacterium TC5R-5]